MSWSIVPWVPSLQHPPREAAIFKGESWPLAFLMNYGTSYRPALVIPGPRPGYSAITHKGRSAVKLTLTGNVSVQLQATSGGYVAVRYALNNIIPSDFTIALGQKWNYAPFVPCISWALVGSTSRIRYRLNNTPGTLPYEPYAGQLIEPLTAIIELWAPGNTHPVQTLTTQTFDLGIFSDDPNVTTTYTVAPCVVGVTGSPGFAAYMTSCS